MTEGPYREGAGTPPRRVRRRLTGMGVAATVSLAYLLGWAVYGLVTVPGLLTTIAGVAASLCWVAAAVGGFFAFAILVTAVIAKANGEETFTEVIEERDS